MRTTLALDDDIFAYARERAKRERISIGQAISIACPRRNPIARSEHGATHVRDQQIRVVAPRWCARLKKRSPVIACGSLLH